MGGRGDWKQWSKGKPTKKAGPEDLFQRPPGGITLTASERKRREERAAKQAAREQRKAALLLERTPFGPMKPLTLANLPEPGRTCLVVGTLSDWPGPERYDVARLDVDHKTGVLVWLGGSFRCEYKAGSPAVTRFAVLPPLTEAKG